MSQPEPDLQVVVKSSATGGEPASTGSTDDPSGAGPEFSVQASEAERFVFDDETVTGNPESCGGRLANAGEATETADVLGAIHRLQETFEQRILLDASREAVISRLHAELQVHNEGLVQRILRPVLMDLIMLHDDIGKLVEAQRDSVGDDAEAKRLLNQLDGVRDDLEDVLSKYGAWSYESDTGTFDPLTQRVLKTVPTADESLSRSICRRHRKGFRFDGLVLRPELVSVWKYEVTAAE